MQFLIMLIINNVITILCVYGLILSVCSNNKVLRYQWMGYIKAIIIIIIIIQYIIFKKNKQLHIIYICNLKTILILLLYLNCCSLW
eukprot:UN01388